MMDILQSLANGFGVIMTPANLYYCFLGSLIGTLIGVLPGIGPLATLSLLLPVTFNLSPVGGISMLAAIFYGAMYGGSTTSVLVNIPGEAASVITCIDGHQMARKGRAGAALGIAAIGSFIAGSLSLVGLTFFSPLLTSLALKFGPPEYCAVMVLGFVATVFMVNGSRLKALLMIALGAFVTCVGMDNVSGQQRFTFGSVSLTAGFDLVPVVIGMFGISEILLNLEVISKNSIVAQKVGRLFPTWLDWTMSFFPIFRGSVIGFGLGVLPGGGPTTAAFVSYAVERQISKHPETFGTGAIEGVAGPEAANNAAVAGSMIPLLSLGLPTNAVTALLLGALIIQGVQPGPMLIVQHPDIFWGVVASMYVGNVMLLILNLPLVGLWVQLLRIPYGVLFPLIVLLAVVGTFSTNKTMYDIWVMIGFGVLGYILRKLSYELTPFILAMVLGPMFEEALRQSLLSSSNGPLIFITRPIPLTILLLASALIALLLVRPGLRRVSSEEA